MSPSSTQFLRALAESLESLKAEQAGEALPIVDYEFRSTIPGSPEEIRVWFILRDRRAKDFFREIDLNRNRAKLTRKLIAAGFPEAAIPSMRISVTSREEAQSGGAFNG